MYDDLYRSLYEIFTFFNRPQQDTLLLRASGVSLDTALFPLVNRIAHSSRIGIVELAAEVDRHYSTVSRQVDRLVERGLVERIEEGGDRRTRKIALTAAGKAMTERISKAREAAMDEALRTWTREELIVLETSLDHLARTLRDLRIR